LVQQVPSVPVLLEQVAVRGGAVRVEQEPESLAHGGRGDDVLRILGNHVGGKEIHFLGGVRSPRAVGHASAVGDPATVTVVSHRIRALHLDALETGIAFNDCRTVPTRQAAALRGSRAWPPPP